MSTFHFVLENTKIPKGNLYQNVKTSKKIYNLCLRSQDMSLLELFNPLGDRWLFSIESLHSA